MLNFDNVSALGENQTHVVDISGNGNNGTVVGGNFTTTDTHFNIGRSMQFDGSQYLNITDSPSLRALDEVTVAAWINPVTLDTSQDHIVAKRNTGVHDSYKMSVRDTGVNFCVAEPAGGCIGPNGSLVVGEWQHIAGSFNETKDIRKWCGSRQYH